MDDKQNTMRWNPIGKSQKYICVIWKYKTLGITSYFRQKLLNDEQATWNNNINLDLLSHGQNGLNDRFTRYQGKFHILLYHPHTLANKYVN